MCAHLSSGTGTPFKRTLPQLATGSSVASNNNKESPVTLNNILLLIAARLMRYRNSLWGRTCFTPVSAAGCVLSCRARAGELAGDQVL